MAKSYNNTYEDLLKDMQANNITFSDYDLALAQKNPDAGRSIYTQKVAYGNATTDEERTAANNAAELIRQQYGGYSGWTDGTGFTLSQTYAPPASEYVSQFQGQIDSLNQKLDNWDPFDSRFQGQIDSLLEQVTSWGDYSGKHQGQIDSLNQQIADRGPYQSINQEAMDLALEQLLNREGFSYNPAQDAAYQAYSENYRNQGGKALQNALGSAAAMTGGQLSSYALTAAQQAQNDYNAQLSNAIPQLQQMAYQMYLDEGDAMRQNLNALIAQDDRAYNRYLDEGNSLYQQLDSLLTQDSVDYGRYQDSYNRTQNALNQLVAMDDRDYSRYQDERDDVYQQLNALLAQDDAAYDRHQAGQKDELDRWQLNYGVNRDMLSDQRYEDELSYERDAYAEDRDYSRNLDKAKTLAAAGDFSGYKALGYSDEEIQRMEKAYIMDQAAAMIRGGGSSGGGKGSGSDSGEQVDDVYTSLYQQMYDAGIRDEANAYEWLTGKGLSDGKVENLQGYYMYDILPGMVDASAAEREAVRKDLLGMEGQIGNWDRTGGANGKGDGAPDAMGGLIASAWAEGRISIEDARALFIDFGIDPDDWIED